ncbi:hypothetical protein [Tunturiibacter gelidoferens]|uniref:Uncharacterized protein n=2 Tax=Tunturiibacter gelidiferens TaxID=3069689 RepID=A0AAU7YWR1_9BACT|nr:hypothetical protein [Edaphobacter lichenicola]MBB5338861.1 hypothetical protein [Edaphobacter lichenicola]
MKITVNQFCHPRGLPIQFNQKQKITKVHEISTEKRIFSVNTAQIIPLFTRLCEHYSKSKGRMWSGLKRPAPFLVVLTPFHTFARFHDEATTSDYGGDIGYQFNISPGANQHGNEKDDQQDASSQKGARRDPAGTPDPRAARADAEPAGPDRCSQTAECR